MAQTIKKTMHMGLIPDWLDIIFLKTLVPLIRFMSSMRISPNWITVMGFVLNGVAAILLVYGRFFTALLCIASAGVCDFIDGKVAARTNRITPFGGILDSILDRYSEMFIFLGMALFYIRNGSLFSAGAAVLALLGSIMTSYVKAIGEAHGFKFRIGFLRRQERITLICIGLLCTITHRFVEKILTVLMHPFSIVLNMTPAMPLSIAVYFLALFTNVSALQRFVFLLKMSRMKGH